MLAGAEAPASTLSWLLLELSRHREDQDKMREEIATIRSRNKASGKEDFDMADYDAMSFMNASIKV